MAAPQDTASADDDATLSEADKKKFATMLDSMKPDELKLVTVYGPLAIAAVNANAQGTGTVSHHQQVEAAADMAYAIGMSIDPSLDERAIYDRVVEAQHTKTDTYIRDVLTGANPKDVEAKRDAITNKALVGAIADMSVEALEGSRKFYQADLSPKIYGTLNAGESDDETYAASVKQFQQRSFAPGVVTPDEVTRAMVDRPVPRRENDTPQR